MKFAQKIAAYWGTVLLCAGGLMAQEAKQKQVKDQVEYDLFQAATRETDPQKKVQHLLTWKEKYPESDFKTDRLVLLIQAYQGAGNGEKMFETCQELLKLEPRNITGLYYTTLLTRSLNNTAPDRLEIGEKASNGLIGVLPEVFAADKKPQQVTADAWNKEKQKMEIEARKTLAFIAMARKQFEQAEKEYTDILKLACTGNVSYQLSTAMLQQRKIEKQIPAMYHVARAAYYTGEDALTPDVAKQVQAYFEKVYVKYHGTKEGMQDVIELTKSSCFPPADFKIKSEAEIMAENDERERTENPQKYLWTGVKRELIGENGQAYFEQIKGTALPKLKGKIVSVSPARRPKEILIGISSDDTAEIKLVVDAAYPNEAPVGTEIEFESAVPEAFSSDPFLLTASIEKSQIFGYPAPAPAAKKTGGAPAKKGATKKQ